MKVKYTKENLIKILQDFYIKNNRVPKTKDFASGSPSTMVFNSNFGTWNNALKEAGLKQNKINLKVHKDNYTKEELIKYLHKYYKEYNKVPTTIELNKHLHYPSSKYFRLVFGNFKTALVEANLFELREDSNHNIFEQVRYTDKELLQLLKDFIDKIGYVPTDTEIDKNKSMPSKAIYFRRFGGYYNALKLIGIDMEGYKALQKKKMEEDMILNYKQLHDRLGRVPTSRDIDEYSKKGFGYATKTYLEHFGTIFELQTSCGFAPTIIGRNKTEDEMLEDLVWLTEHLGRVPTANDIDDYNHMVGQSTYFSRFGSFTNALKLAGLNPKVKVIYTPLGTKCLSKLEFKFATMLENYKIDFLKDDLYSNHIADFDKRYTFDFVLNINNEKVYIEIFGIINNEYYDKKTLEKIDICKESNIPLISLYPKDLGSIKHEKTYKMLLQKIECV